MECTVPVEVKLATDHADVGALEQVVTAALARVGQTLWAGADRAAGALVAAA